MFAQSLGQPQQILTKGETKNGAWARRPTGTSNSEITLEGGALPPPLLRAKSRR
jgi:hypothetical protein